MIADIERLIQTPGIHKLKKKINRTLFFVTGIKIFHLA